MRLLLIGCEYAGTTTLAENFVAINGTAVLAKVTLTANQIARRDTVNIEETSIFKNSNNTEIEPIGRFNGIIEVVQ